MKSSNWHEDSQVVGSDLGRALDYTGLSVDEAVSLLARWTSAEQARLNQFYDYDAVTAAINAERDRRSGITVPRPAIPSNPFDTLMRPMDIAVALRTDPSPIDMVLPGLKAGSVGAIGGAGGVSKSYLAAQTAISTGIGLDLFGIWGLDPKPGRVVYLSLEDDQDVLDVRLREIARGFEKALEACRGNTVLPVDSFDDIVAAVQRNVHIVPLYGRGFRIAEKDEKAGRIAAGTAVDSLKRFLGKSVRGEGVRLTILDTFNRAIAGLDENDNGEMGAVMSVLDEIALETGSAQVFVHHLHKGGIFQGKSETLDQSALRGASVLVDNARWLLLMATMNEEQSKARYGDVWEDHHRRWVKRMVVKQNYGVPVEDHWLRRGDGGVLNGHERPQDAPEADGKTGVGKKIKATSTTDDLPSGWVAPTPVKNGGFASF